VWQDHDLTITVEGAVKVPPKNFDTLLKMLVAFREGDAPEPEAPAALPLHEEGVCPKCSSHKMLADGDARRCLQCEFAWRVA
jgi:hypothetical protein